MGRINKYLDDQASKNLEVVSDFINELSEMPDVHFGLSTPPTIVVTISKNLYWVFNSDDVVTECSTPTQINEVACGRNIYIININQLFEANENYTFTYLTINQNEIKFKEEIVVEL